MDELVIFNNVKRKRKPTRKNQGEQVKVRREPKPHYKLSPALSADEREIIESMDGVYFKPRPRLIGYKYLDDVERWEIMGFTSLSHYETYNYLHRLSNEEWAGNEVDILGMTVGGKNE
ncbi:hypothetical protein [Serratia ficaria]|uniref:hypothetical protein n=1 Tax=Serratia ficaria TaxID=61651 RepID=UPI0021C680EB|nr:hypothetical protein [Serratia ficaria]